MPVNQRPPATRNVRATKHMDRRGARPQHPFSRPTKVDETSSPAASIHFHRETVWWRWFHSLTRNSGPERIRCFKAVALVLPRPMADSAMGTLDRGGVVGGRLCDAGPSLGGHVSRYARQVTVAARAFVRPIVAGSGRHGRDLFHPVPLFQGQRGAARELASPLVTAVFCGLLFRGSTLAASFSRCSFPRLLIRLGTELRVSE